MPRSRSTEGRLPKGVTELPRPRGGRRYRAAIRHKGNEVHLGLYETPWLAAFAFNVASVAIGRGAKPPNEIPGPDQPSAERVRAIAERVRVRLGLDRPSRGEAGDPPSAESLLTFFEVTVVGFWRGQAASGSDDGFAAALDASAGRIVEAARLLFRDRGMPAPEEAMTGLLARRLDQEFRRGDLTREVLEDDGDEPRNVARWLAHPDRIASDRGFREEVRHRYPESFEGEREGPTGWADVLGLKPPFGDDQIREAYRARSRRAHPDAGGTHEEFIRLNAAYEAARLYLRMRGEE